MTTTTREGGWRTVVGSAGRGHVAMLEEEGVRCHVWGGGGGCVIVGSAGEGATLSCQRRRMRRRRRRRGAPPCQSRSRGAAVGEVTDAGRGVPLGRLGWSEPPTSLGLTP